MEETFKCSVCGKTKPTKGSGGVGYGNDIVTNKKVCYECCGEKDFESLKNAKIGDKFMLYLNKRYYNEETNSFDKRNINNEKNMYSYFVSNWPGTMEFKCSYSKTSRHNIGRTRTDVWFGNETIGYWCGYNIGDFTQIVHCRKITKKSYYR